MITANPVQINASTEIARIDDKEEIKSFPVNFN